MTKPLKDQKLIIACQDGIHVIENLTRKEIKEFSDFTSEEKADFLDNHNESFYTGDNVYRCENNVSEEEEFTEEDTEEYFKDLHEYILDNWKSKGTVVDEENTRTNIDMITYLLCNYRLQCLLSTILDIEDLWEKFDKE